MPSSKIKAIQVVEQVTEQRLQLAHFCGFCNVLMINLGENHIYIISLDIC